MGRIKVSQILLVQSQLTMVMLIEQLSIVQNRTGAKNIISNKMSTLDLGQIFQYQYTKKETRGEYLKTNQKQLVL